MFRLALRSAAPRALPRSAAAVSVAPRMAFARAYSAPALSRDDITSRILDIMRSFEKVDAGKVTPTSSFTTDLGLDSLDAVEVVMAIEEEFAIEIPDVEADAINSVAQAIEYVGKTPEGESH